MLDLMPSGEFGATDMCEVSSRELAWRRAFLERLIAHPGTGAELQNAIASALAKVTAEQEGRARAYALDPDTPHRCSCGFRCTGLAGIDDHLGGFWGDYGHDELVPVVADWREGS